MPTSGAASGETTLREFGEQLALSAASVQADLAQSATETGMHVLDELEVTVPVRLRVDDLGQVLVAPVATEAEPRTVVRFKIKATERGDAVAPVTTYPLEVLGVLDKGILAALRSRRVFSVADLERIALTPAGRVGLEDLGLRSRLPDVLDRAAVLRLPGVPAEVAVALLKMGLSSPLAFAERDAAAIADQAGAVLGAPLAAETVRAWQDAARTWRPAAEFAPMPAGLDLKVATTPGGPNALPPRRPAGSRADRGPPGAR